MDLSQGTMNSNRGLYATACEKSPNRQLIDQWLNEGKSNSWISKQLKGLGEKISDKSVGKYRQYREEHLNKELMKEPLFQAQMQKANDAILTEVGKFKQVNVINHLAETVEHCAGLITQSQLDNIRIKNVQDLRYVQMTMLEALRLYGDTVMKAQQYQKIEENPDLIRPAVNVNVRNVLTDVFKNMSEEDRFAVIDKIRGGGSDNE